MTPVSHLVPGQREYLKQFRAKSQTKFRAAVSVVAGAAGLCLLGAMPGAAQTLAPVMFPYTINTIAGTGSGGTGTNGGVATSQPISADLRAIAVDTQGDVYFTDTGNNLVWEINHATGDMTIVAGGAKVLNGGSVCSAHIDEGGDDCPAASETLLDEPRGLALDKAGNVYIADYGASEIHEVVKATGEMILVAGAVSNHNDNATKTYSGDGGKANVAGLNEPRGVRVDNQGNIWICDTGNNVIREVNAQTGIITTVIGSDANGASPDTAGYTGDGGPASSAEMNEPTDIVFDAAGNAYIVDFNNKVIREVTASNGAISSSSTINTIIGNDGTASTTAPTGPVLATSWALGSPTKIDIDSEGNLYFADSGESVIYFYDASTKYLTAIAGEYGYAGSATNSTTGANYAPCSANTDSLGDGCPALQSLFYQGNSALAMAIDGNNNLYITDPNDERIREVSTNLSFPPTAVGQNVAQTVEVHFFSGDTPSATAALAVTGSKDYSIQGAPSCTTNPDSTSTCTASVQFAPTTAGLRSAPLTAVNTAGPERSFPLYSLGEGALTTIDPGTVSTLGSGLSAPHGEALDAAGNLYIADTGNNRVVEVSAAGAQTVIASSLSAPQAVTVGPRGTVYIADTGNNVVRAYNPLTSTTTVVAGGGSGCGASANTYDLAVDTLGDGCPATDATLKAPAGLATDSYGNLYIADTGDNVIRVVDARTGTINLYAGLATFYLNQLDQPTYAATVCTTAANPDDYGDGCSPFAASFSGPTGITMDSNGNLFVADTGDNLVREVSLGSQLVTRVAGNGQSVFTGDGGVATTASLDGPTAVAEDAAGDIYIADTGNQVIREISSASGDINTVLGQGASSGSSGGSGSAVLLALNAPSGLALDAFGNLYVGDTGNNRAFVDNRNAGLLDFVNENVGVATPEQTATITNAGNQAATFSASPFYTASGNTSDFNIDLSGSTACSDSSLAVSASCTVAASFDPTAVGSFNDSLAFPGNVVNESTATLNLIGQGVNLATTTLTLQQSSPSGSVAYGEAATFTATVAPTSGSGTPTGTVTFSVDGKEEAPAATLSSGVASLTVNLAVGSHTISAIYSGDSTYVTSNASISVPVTLAPTTTVLTLTPATQIQNQPVTLSAQVASTTGGIPTGTVTFISGSTTLATAALNASGVASAQYSTSTVSSYPVVAIFSGDANYATSTSASQTLVINPIPPDFTPTLENLNTSTATNPVSLSVPQGGTGSLQVNLATQGGITGTVKFSCTGLPANTTCTFFPTTVDLPTQTLSTICAPPSGTTDVCTNLTITTDVNPLALSTQTAENHNGAQRIVAATLLLPMLLFGLGLSGTRKRRLPGMMLAILGFAGIGLLQGCAKNATQAAGNLTPGGSYTVTVVMNGPDSITHSVPFTLNVITSSNAQ